MQIIIYTYLIDIYNNMQGRWLNCEIYNSYKYVFYRRLITFSYYQERFNRYI